MPSDDKKRPPVQDIELGSLNKQRLISTPDELQSSVQPYDISLLDESRDISENSRVEEVSSNANVLELMAKDIPQGVISESTLNQDVPATQQVSEAPPAAEPTQVDDAGVSSSDENTMWIEYFDSGANRSYYHNPRTKTTKWVLPEGARLSEAESEMVKEMKLVEDDVDTLKSIPADLQRLTPEDVRAIETERSAAIARQITSRSRTETEKAAALAATGRCLPLPAGLLSLPDKLKVFMRHDRPPTASEMGRPARIQARPEDFKNLAYVQGNEDFNIWYGKYASERIGEGGRRERAPAPSHCNVFKDAGFTRADLSPHLATNPICLYFAKGCCTLGHECSYYHHVPTREENDKLDLMHDIFGRERHAQQRDDMEGVGSFNSTSRTLFVGDYKVDKIDGSSMNKIESLILAHFAVFGPIEDMRVVPNRNFAFLTYCYRYGFEAAQMFPRAAAEFAKVAMANHKLTEGSNEVLTVKWAQGNRNPASQMRVAAREYDDARRIVMERMRQLAIQEADYIASKQQKQDDIQGDDG